MPSNSKAFADMLRKLAQSYPEQVYMPRFRRMGFKVLEVAAQVTPVNFGTLRNGWHLTIGSPSKSDTKVAEGREALTEVLEKGLAVLNDATFGQGVWIQNNTPYATVYEYGLFRPTDPGPSKALHVPLSRRATVAGTVLIRGGYNVTAPQGMLADAIQVVAAAMQSGSF